MTDRLGEIQGRVRSVQQLANVVAVMRSIAATRAQQSRNLLPAIDAYARMVGDAIAQAVGLVAEDGAAETRVGGGSALVLFAAEQGFAGAYGDTVLTAGQHALAGGVPTDGAPTGEALFLIGSRAGRQARERGWKVAWAAPMAGHPDAIAGLAGNVAEGLYAAIREGGIGRVEVMFPIWRPGEELRVERRSLLPLDSRRFVVRGRGQPPLITLPPALLLERLAEEYVTAQLCEAATHAFAAENEARAAAMLRAKTNIAAMMEGLAAEERLVRQEAITAEVVELAGGRLA